MGDPQDVFNSLSVFPTRRQKLPKPKSDILRFPFPSNRMFSYNDTLMYGMEVGWCQNLLALNLYAQSPFGADSLLPESIEQKTF